MKEKNLPLKRSPGLVASTAKKDVGTVQMDIRKWTDRFADMNTKLLKSPLATEEPHPKT